MINAKRFHKAFHGFPGRIRCGCCNVKRPGSRKYFRAGRKQLSRIIAKVENLENDQSSIHSI